MAISLASLQTSTVLRPPRVLIHGVAGIGKSTFAASADAPTDAPADAPANSPGRDGTPG